jgi:hypothetical protein
MQLLLVAVALVKAVELLITVLFLLLVEEMAEDRHQLA